jgi:hypothetical protein
MTFEADLVALLVGDAAIAAAIEDQAANERRIYPLERPQRQTNLAALVYTVIFATPAQNLEGEEGGLENVRVQLDVWAATHDDARALALLVQARMAAGNQSIRSLRNSRASDIDPDTREHREVLDFSVWHSP